jgi:hypothetical protein
MTDTLTRWVGARLTGGLGNRLFQLAAAHNLSVLWKMPLIFAMPYCTPSEHGDYESIFKLFPDVAKVWNPEPLLGIQHDKCWEVSPLPATPPADRVLLRGYWQAPDYISKSFEPSWKSIVDDDLLARWNLVTPEQQQKTVFIHVRLGDFRTLPHHQLVDAAAYYSKAIALFPEDVRFLVFSDEPDVAKTYSFFNDRCVFVNEPNEVRALFLMSRCQGGAITANSTFSWWGAFFGKQEAGEIYRACMPAQWMASTTESYDDIYPTWATKL